MKPCLGCLRRLALLVWFGALVAVGALGPVATVQAQASPASPYEIAIARDVMVTMRDGVRMATDVYRPAREGAPVEGRFPVILERTPYNKDRRRGAGQLLRPARLRRRQAGRAGTLPVGGTVAPAARRWRRWANAGIYRSVNGGTAFTKITNGLPAYTGKVMLDVCSADPDEWYASVADEQSGLGVYRSSNGGLSWYQANATNFQTYQGWYSHDVSVHPDFKDEFVAGGIDMHFSGDGGASLNQTTYWYNCDFNATTVGGQKVLLITFMLISTAFTVIPTEVIPFTWPAMAEYSVRTDAGQTYEVPEGGPGQGSLS